MFYNNKETQRNSEENFWPAVDWTYFFLPHSEPKSSQVLLIDIHHYFSSNWRHISWSRSLDFLQICWKLLLPLELVAVCHHLLANFSRGFLSWLHRWNSTDKDLSSLIEMDRWPQTEHMLFKLIFGHECIYSDQAGLYNMQSRSYKPLLRQLDVNKGEEMKLHGKGYQYGKVLTDSPSS